MEMLRSFFMMVAAVLVATAAVSNAQVVNGCGVQPSTINFLGSLAGRQLGFYLGLSFTSYCSKTTMNVKVTNFTVGGGGLSAPAAAGLCSNQDIGAMSRPWLPAEGTDVNGDNIYQCNVGDKSRSALQIDAAIGALVIIVRKGTMADTCLAKLSGLTIAQLRAIYSGTTAPKFSDLDPSCPQTSIRGIGPLSASDAGVLFSNVAGFTTYSPRYESYANDIGVQTNTVNDCVGIISLSLLRLGEMNGNVRAISIQNENGRFVAPTALEIGTVHDDGKTSDAGHNHDNGEASEYPLAYRLYFNLFEGTLAKTRPFLDYVLSNAGTAAIVVNGLVPIPLLERLEMRSRLGLAASKPPSSGGVCFPGIATVQVEGKGTVELSTLKIGDSVKVSANKFDRVYSFGHFDADVVFNEYLSIHVGPELALDVSPSHLVFTSSGSIPASQVRVGDEMRLGANSDVLKVTKIETVTRLGAFAPFTYSGTMVVNGFIVSSYVTLDSENEILSGLMHWMGHLIVAPRRLFCRLSFENCRRETYNDEGIATWVAPLNDVSQWLVHQHAVIMILGLLPAISVAIILAILESTALLIAVCAIAVVAVSMRKPKKMGV